MRVRPVAVDLRAMFAALFEEGQRQREIALFGASGRVGRDVDDLFKEASWMQVMLGQGIVPDDYDPMADQMSDAQLGEFLASLRTIIERSVAGLPTHEDYLARHCPAAALDAAA